MCECAARIERLERQVTRLADSHRDILTVFTEIREQVEPVVKAVSESPLGKMLGVSNG